MDLRSMLNDGAAAAGAQGARKPPPPPQGQPQPPPPPHAARPASRHQLQQQQQQQHPHGLPSTPIQTGPPPHAFHDHHPPSVQPSPARSLSREYHGGPQTPFGSPPPPQQYGGPTPYGASGRPQPPPLQHLSSSSMDMRSPGAGPGSVVSPYPRNTPNSAVRADSAGYPFPSPGHPHPPDLASPVQQHRYPPSAGAYPPPREGYPPPHAASVASPGPMGHPPPPGYFPVPHQQHPQHPQQQQQQQQQQPVPQTPPVGTPGGPHHYLSQPHQRSGSTPSHHAYPSQPFVSPVVTNHPPPPHAQHPQQQQQQQQQRPSSSQPPTPHGPPLSTSSRQSSGPVPFAQSPSPYQPRLPSSGGQYPQYPAQHPQQPPPHQQGPPAPPAPPAPPPPPSHHHHHHQQQQPQQQQQQQPQSQQPSPRNPSHPQPSPRSAVQRAPSIYDQPPGRPYPADPHRSSLSHSERERSISISPKTPAPSLPSSAGRRSQASLSGPPGEPAEFDPRDPRQLPPNAMQQQQQQQMREVHVKPEREAPPQTSAIRPERATTPAKRKLDDRDLKPEDLDRQEPRPPPFQSNGAANAAVPTTTTTTAAAAATVAAAHRPSSSSSRPSAAHPSDSPMLARRKPRHRVRPAWAQTFDRQQLKYANYYLRKPTVHYPQVNGNTESAHASARQDRPTSRHVSPEASRAPPAAAAAAAAAAAPPASAPGPPAHKASPAPPPPPPPAASTKPKLLGPWEESMANTAPLNELCKVVADFLFIHVVNPMELRDLHGRPGVNFEIEAKLGCLVERDHSGARIQLPVQSEVALSFTPNPHYNFSSSMTELQHKNYNEFLNSLVADTSPQNPKNKSLAEPRVPINYVHTREIDKFYNPKEARQSLHPILQSIIDARGLRSPSVRVTTERGGRVVAKIIKVKVADLHIYFPMCDLDCRISVNVEVDYEGPVDEQPDGGPGVRADRADRHKDRLSYTQGLYKVDLTQVTQPDAGGQATARKIHELEIELNAAAVIDQGRRAMQSQPHNYDFLVEGFVNNIRLLARKAREFPHA
ncbi:CYTH-like domain-containing protein [Coniella lustricola]|uniref:mRNA-capping enzyme subunit beta n=1 Tax=Coniella lustricola TaxID=2025994 RepID=A0A2T2ZVW9_9PEZI|nr:CYTH-like domain-containing protein [Coniella lustricola]